jgi:hypothetical protein
MARIHTRIIQHPFVSSLQGALLDSYAEAGRAGELNITLTIRALERTSSDLYDSDGRVLELVQGTYVPIKIHFAGVSGLKRGDFFQTIKNLPTDDPARIINDMLSWRQPERRDVFYLFFMHQADNLMFFADQATYERLTEEPIAFVLERDWCPPPPIPERLIPQPKALHQRFAGDPISLRIENRNFPRRLFIGGLDTQGNERPQVDVVFNLGEERSKWIKDHQTNPQDRWDNKGEGSDGMSLEVIREEAEWVIERLMKNQRVLIHCVAGMNRSSTICCAVLILLEGLTAEQALERVRRYHPWARPDSGHWLKLRWLAKTTRQSR